MTAPDIDRTRNFCDRCLGRIFSGVSTGLTNEQRGIIVRSTLETFNKTKHDFTGNCEICGNIFTDLEKYLEMCKAKIDGYVFHTFRIGSVFDDTIIKKEKAIHEELGAESETIKKEFNRELGKLFSESTGTEYEMNNPEIELTVDTRYDSVAIRSESLFLYGTYKKLVRGMPQTRWIHGSGDTVESIIGTELCRLLKGENYFLHGAGREDVDVRMLGNGRQFVVEISNPRTRTFSISQYRKSVNSGKKISIHNLSITDKKKVVELKASRNSKSYVARIESSGQIDPERLEKTLESLNGKIIYQRTPLRVSRRRADLIRERRLLETELISTRGKKARIRIRAEAGTYVKELVSGDGGRTNPSLASEYGENLTVTELDVTRIHR